MDLIGHTCSGAFRAGKGHAGARIHSGMSYSKNAARLKSYASGVSPAPGGSCKIPAANNLPACATRSIPTISYGQSANRFTSFLNARTKRRVSQCAFTWIYLRFLFLSQKRSPATFDFGADVPPEASATVKLGLTPFAPSWNVLPTPATRAPAAGAYSCQPFGQLGRLNARTVCSGKSCACAGKQEAPKKTIDIAAAIRMI